MFLTGESRREFGEGEGDSSCTLFSLFPGNVCNGVGVCGWWVYRTLTLNTAECGGEGWCVLRGVTSTELTLHDDSGCGGAASLSEETSLLDMES